QRYPDVRVLQADARDLSRWADQSFQLVVFSFNGIDAVNPEGRATILREAHRVLRKGGAFLFSAHNHDGPGHREKLSFGANRTRNPFKYAGRLARALVHAPRAIHNHERLSKLNYDGDGFSILNASAHDHGILIHYVSLPNQLKQLEDTGFRPGALVFSNADGRRLSPGDDTSGTWWFHFVVRK
ncbi:MAG TPA: class I SAM-dependent methyltransferase, partial [Polyangiaceae bacterium]